MRSRLFRAALALAVVTAWIGTTASLRAQGLTGQISGTITDSGGGVLPGASVTIRNVGTNLTRETTTRTDGTFVFPDLLAGTFDLTASMTGFKTYEQKGIVLGAQERVALRAIVLEVGALQETISVQAEVALVQTQNGARSAVVSADQIEDIGLKGRDFLGTLKLLPGVVDTSNREAPGWNTLGGISINGRSGINLTYDGIKNQDTGTASNGPYASPGLDAIAEIKVQTSNFQAEYGRSAGGSINVITKSGTRNFRGSLAYYKRHEALNSQDWNRKRDCGAGNLRSCEKAPYRYDNTAYTFGGPVLLPGTSFNANRDKLFFFWSHDMLPRTDPGNLQTLNMPTALERKGDFSQTFDSQGRAIWIRDPLASGTCNLRTGAGGACFPNRVIPANRFDPTGLALLNMLPLPNTSDPTGTRAYNYTYQTTHERPRRDQILRGDWNVGPRTTFYSRWQFGYEARKGEVAQLGFSGNWPAFPTKYEIPTWGMVNTLLHTFDRTMVLEATFGVNKSKQLVAPYTDKYADAHDRYNRDLVLTTFPQFFPEANPWRVLPQVSFGGTNALANTAGFGVEQRFPFTAGNDIWNFNLNLTKLKGSHNLKFGLYVDRTARPASRSSAFNGNLNYNADVNNVYDTNLGWANALLGSLNSYTEADVHPYAQGRFNQIEWFAQDNWRLKRNFTLDYGVRFYLIGPTFTKGQPVATFVPSLWDPAKAPLLFEPVCPNNAATCSQTTRRARNPVTGEILPAVFIGRLVPGSGDRVNGMKIWDNGTPFEWSSLLLGPRVGFAWDVTGDGKTAVRGGAGIFYDRGFGDDTILSLVQNPPLVNTYTASFTTIPLLRASPLTVSPQGPNAFLDDKAMQNPRIINYSIGVQRDIGFKMVADVAYVGNTGRGLATGVQINGQPYGFALRPENLDPTNVRGGIMQPKGADFLRPYRGYSGISLREYHGKDIYHSIQVSVNRRPSAGITFGLAYTGSIRRSIGTRDPFVSASENYNRFWTAAGSRPHNLTINYSYEVPDLSKKWNNLLTRTVLDGWQVSGVTTMLGGTRGSVGVSFDDVPTGVIVNNGSIGGSFGMRPVFVCDPNLPRNERTFDRQFRTECVAPPGGPGDPMFFGTALGDELLGLGYINHDITVFKNVSLKNGRRLQLRFELYNAFNSVQYSGYDSSAEFDYLSWMQRGEVAQTDANFGRVTGAREGRRIQLGIRFTF